MSTITLGSFIKLLEMADPAKVVSMSLGNLHSFRGHPTHLAISAQSASTVQEMLHEARAAVGAEVTGYKDGEYLMELHTEIHFAFYGSMDEHPEWFPSFVDELFS
jgi:hypothetical protein